MNFFSHYYLDHKEGNTVYNFGLIYPDLFRDLYKLKEPSIFFNKENSDSLDEDLINFSQGISMHLYRDSIFHPSLFFADLQIQVKSVLIQHLEIKDIPRYWFFIHVLSEMFVDRKLVALYPREAKQMYVELELCVKQFNSKRDWFKEKKNFEVFMSRMQKITLDKHIFAYTNNEMFLSTLWWVYKKAGLNIMSDSLKKEIDLKLNVALHDLDKIEIDLPKLKE